MSKYDPLWAFLQRSGQETVALTHEQIGAILGFHSDHAFLTYKKEAPSFGYEVDKISLKQKTVLFHRLLAAGA